ncbi:hypothetical protein FA15DRAFT_254871 [Coprinopsis marcescibilis]|uniref:F-box domain-containing protein n=1 Tax=Coprinopsis marcescibilis TaxID=230819 RepID=A0A5C3KEW9_COPMA|nr:hypothetical protein FA15DRAFT_254871 [Coprinopsis marcescibilis]
MTLCTTYPDSFMNNLTTLTVVFSHDPPTLDVRSVVERVSQIPCFKRIELQGAGVHIPARVLQSLLAIPTLSEIVFDVGIRDIIGEGLLIGLIRERNAHRNENHLLIPDPLRTLELPVCHSSPIENLASLEYTARNMECLQQLRIRLDSSTHSLSPNGRLVQPEQTRSMLRELEVHEAQITLITPRDHLAIARFLDRIFPNLESIRVHSSNSPSSESFKQSWEFIDELRMDARLLRIHTGTR